MKKYKPAPKDHQCKNCGRLLTKRQYSRNKGLCFRCDVKSNPQNWGGVEMFSVKK